MIRIFILLFAICLFSCRPESDSTSSAPQEETAEIELPEDFLTFYEEFHRDSVFQLNHIAFPLSGKPASRQFNVKLTDYKWTRDGWTIHKRIADDDDTFDRKFKVYSKDLVTEFIYSPGYGYYMERRFGKLSDGWNLIYYADMQEPKGGAQSQGEE